MILPFLDEPTRRRFWAKVSTGDAKDCWSWTASCYRTGYGQFGVRAGIIRAAPRIAWMIEHRKEAEGVICHACDNPLCCNPAHLWLGTPGDNSRDASNKGRMNGQQKTSCAKGHAYTVENTYRRPNGSRDCRQCIRERVARYQGRAA